MRYLTLGELLDLHRLVVEASGGLAGVRDLGAIESALAQPHATFEGQDLHPTLPAKAAALGFSLVKNHGFLDGNKRVGHFAMVVFLALNGQEIVASVDEQESIMLTLAEGKMSRENLAIWLATHLVAVESGR